MNVLIQLLVCLLPFVMQAMPDSTVRRKPIYDLEALQADTFLVESDFTQGFNFGWFPGTYSFDAIEISSKGSSLFDDGMYQSGIANAYHINNLPFIKNHSFSEEAREQLLPFSMKTNDDIDIPMNTFSIITLRAVKGIPSLGLNIRYGMSIASTQRVLFSEDRTKLYLGLDGTKKELHELHTYSIDDYEVQCSAGFQLPLYGAYLTFADEQVHSYYTLFADCIAGYVAYAEALHTSTIMSDNAVIRYPNGSNVLVLSSGNRPAMLNALRLYTETGMGWQLKFGPIHLGLEAYGMIPLTTIMSDSPWKTWYYGLRSHLGFSW